MIFFEILFQFDKLCWPIKYNPKKKTNQTITAWDGTTGGRSRKGRKLTRRRRTKSANKLRKRRTNKNRRTNKTRR
jgi:hypothetical protein